MNYLIIIFLVCLSGLFSGLTLGFFSLNKNDLRRKAELGNKKAQKIYNIRKNGNLLLCTLLIGNVAVNSALSIFLGSLTTGFAAGLMATALIVIFGEILPQATFSRYAMIMASKVIWLVKLFIILLMPICYPLAWILDKMLGKEIPSVYSRQELIRIVEEHEESKHSDIDEDEEKIIKGALSYSNKVVKDVMTPCSQVFLLSAEEKLTRQLIQNIQASGHSRIPVYKDNQNNIIGLLYAKDLIHLNPSQKIVSDIARTNINFVDAETNLDVVLNSFKNTRHHLFLVKNKKKVCGIITIEDVIEEIIGEEIIDEFDKP